MERKSEQQKLCKKSRCRNAYNRGFELGRYGESRTVSSTPRSEPKSKVPERAAAAPAWRIVADPELTPSQLHCATIPDGPNCQWKGGDYDRIEAKNKAALKAAEEAEIEAHGYFGDPEWREVISPDGVKCFVAQWDKAPETKQRTVLPIPDDLSIPEFLRRPLPRPELRLAA